VRQLRSASRQSGGVRGIRLAKGDRVVGMEIARPEQQLLVVSSKGYGKRTLFEEYPTQGRGGLGVRTFTVNERRGQLVAARTVNSKQELMIISEDGIVIRTAVDSIALQGRATMGVTLMGVGPGDTVASIASIELAKRVGEKAATGKKPAAKGEAAAKPTAAAKTRASAKGKAVTPKKSAVKGKVAAKPAAAAKTRAAVKGKAAAEKKPAAKGKTTAKPAAAAKTKASARGKAPAPKKPASPRRGRAKP
jgi:hypothetical protein